MRTPRVYDLRMFRKRTRGRACPCLRRDDRPRGVIVNALNVSGVFALFETAISNSLKYPKIRLQTSNGQNVVLSRAGDKSRYNGQIQITDGRPYGANTYFGRIDK